MADAEVTPDQGKGADMTLSVPELSDSACAGRGANKKARQTDLAGLRAGMVGGLLLGEVEAVELHDLRPGGDEVLEELLLGVGARVDFREGAEDIAVLHDDFGEAWPRFPHRRQPGPEMHLHAGLPRHVFEDLLRLARLDRIGVAGTVLAARHGGVGSILFQFLPVARHEPREILAGEAAHGTRIADVHGAESAVRHAAEMPARLGQDHRLAHPRGLHGGRDSA